jgi:hypothetical protein
VKTIYPNSSVATIVPNGRSRSQAGKHDPFYSHGVSYSGFSTAITASGMIAVYEGWELLNGISKRYVHNLGADSAADWEANVYNYQVPGLGYFAFGEAFNAIARKQVIWGGLSSDFQGWLDAN